MDPLAIASQSSVAETPFDPSADYAFEPELTGAVPRPIPREAWNGRYAEKRRKVLFALLWIALFSLLLAPLPWVKECAKYFTPLAYLRWIGFGALAVAVGHFIEGMVVLGPGRYIRDGVPLVARCISLVKGPRLIVNCSTVTYAITTRFEYRDPASGVVKIRAVESSEFSASQKDLHTTSFRVGDYVTAIYLPNDLSRSLRLYCLLDLMPHVGLVRRFDEGSEREYLWKIPLSILLGIGFLAVLLWNAIAFGRYLPMNFGVRQGIVPFTAGAVLIGATMIAGVWRARQREARRLRAWNARALASGEPLEAAPANVAGEGGFRAWALGLILVLGGVLIGGATILCWSFTANALFDDSPPRKQAVQITDLSVTTHSYVAREYKIKYRLPGTNDIRTLLTSPEHLARFQGNAAIAETHAGRFGWPWVKTIEPVNAVAPPQR